MIQDIYTTTAWTNTGVSEFVEILATDSAKECVCKKFIKDQKVIILTRVELVTCYQVASRTAVFAGLFLNPC